MKFTVQGRIYLRNRVVKTAFTVFKLFGDLVFIGGNTSLWTIPEQDLGNGFTQLVSCLDTKLWTKVKKFILFFNCIIKYLHDHYPSCL